MKDITLQHKELCYPITLLYQGETVSQELRINISREIKCKESSAHKRCISTNLDREYQSKSQYKRISTLQPIYDIIKLSNKLH